MGVFILFLIEILLNGITVLSNKIPHGLVEQIRECTSKESQYYNHKGFDNGVKVDKPIVMIPISSEEDTDALGAKDSILLVERMFYNVYDGYSEFDGQRIEGYYNKEFGLVALLCEPMFR